MYVYRRTQPKTRGWFSDEGYKVVVRELGKAKTNIGPGKRSCLMFPGDVAEESQQRIRRGSHEDRPQTFLPAGNVSLINVHYTERVIFSCFTNKPSQDDLSRFRNRHRTLSARFDENLVPASSSSTAAIPVNAYDDIYNEYNKILKKYSTFDAYVCRTFRKLGFLNYRYIEFVVHNKCGRQATAVFRRKRPNKYK